MHLVKKVLKSKFFWLGFVLLFCLLLAGVNLSLNRIATSIISPERRAIQEYHKVILGDPGARGMIIESLMLEDGRVPVILATPAHSVGKRGAILRKQLLASGYELPLSTHDDGACATLVILHGRTGRKEDMLPIAERFCAAGFRCILPDLPAHGDSPIAVSHYGSEESESLIAQRVFNALSEKYNYSDQPVHLMGISMGGSFATYAASLPDAPWETLTIVASFGSLEKVIEHKAPQYLQGLVARKIVSNGGTAPEKIAPQEIAKEVKIPVLQLHGTEDDLIPLAQAKEYFDSFGSNKKEFIEVAEANHDTIFITEMEVYATIAKFLLDHQLEKLKVIDVEIVLNKKTYLSCEHVQSKVIISNRGSEELVLTSDESSWLEFSITRNGKSVNPVKQWKFQKCVIPPGGKAARKVVLTTMFPLIEPGHYTVKAHVNSPSNKMASTSPNTVHFDVHDGNIIYSQEHDVKAKPGKKVRYQLQTLQIADQSNLYFQILNSKDNQILHTRALGSHTGITVPQMKVDDDGYFHILYSVKDGIWQYAKFDDSGKILDQEVLQAPDGAKPTLVSNKKGLVGVGVRKRTKFDPVEELQKQDKIIHRISERP